MTIPYITPDALWQAALDELRLQMTRAAYDTWLGGSHALLLAWPTTATTSWTSPTRGSSLPPWPLAGGSSATRSTKARRRSTAVLPSAAFCQWRLKGRMSMLNSRADRASWPTRAR
jgi:hypothetical protein